MSILPNTNLEQWRFVQGWDVNASGVLFGGRLLAYMDEDTTLLAYRVCPDRAFTTVGMDRIAFLAPAKLGDRLRFSYNLAHAGKTSLTVKAAVFNHLDKPIFQGHATLVCVFDSVPNPHRLHEGIVRQLLETPAWKLVEKLREERMSDPK